MVDRRFGLRLTWIGVLTVIGPSSPCRAQPDNRADGDHTEFGDHDNAGVPELSVRHAAGVEHRDVRHATGA